MRLAVRHQSPPRSIAASHEAAWRTCLRQVIFLDTDTDTAAGPDLLTDEQAYALLLEVLCGLQSPMLGETEVMGQFKTFLADLPTPHVWVRRVGQRLLADAGDVRERHLRHLGTRTYGSAVRRRVRPCTRIAVIGTGQLAGEIIPFLLKDSCDIDQWGRTDAAREPLPPSITYRPLASASRSFDMLSLEPSAVVVAAPAPAATIEAVLRQYADLRVIVDLRGEPDRPLQGTHVPVEPLAAVFAELERARGTADQQCAEARAEIVRRSRQFGSVQHLRPFGWDDLCA